MTNDDAYKFLPSVFRLALEPGVILWPVMAVGVSIFVVVLTNLAFWEKFALHNKWASRIALCVLAFFVAWPLVYTDAALFSVLPGKIRMEAPMLTSTAIKLGLTGLYMQHEVENRLPPEKKAAVNCIAILSEMQASLHKTKCGEDRACIENIPPSSRAEIIEAIKDSQTGKTDDFLASAIRSPCKSVDASKL